MFLDSFEVFDLALGKPPLFCLPSNASLKEAMELSKDMNLSEISVWDEQLNHCLGVLNTLDILCFLAELKTQNPHLDPDAAFSHPISTLIHKASIQYVNLHDRLSKALEMVVAGVQFLVVPLPTCMKKSGGGGPVSNTPPPKAKRWPRKELCWISQEAVMRFMMSCIAAFCPVPLFSIDELGVINREFVYVQQQDPAFAAIHLIRQASQNMSAVAVVQSPPPAADKYEDKDEHRTRVKVVGDISSSSLRNCDEILTVTALTTLSAGDFLSYVNGGSKRSPGINNRMMSRQMSFEGESSDSEHDSGTRKSQGHRACLTCRPWSSLAAVMAQALSHQSRYIWVTEADNTLVGIVTFVDIIRVLVRKVDQAGRSTSNQKLFSSTPKLVLSR